jgi:putative FmdB family regulatory protein
MPIYDYECSVCKSRVEILQRISDPYPEACERCGTAHAMNRIISSSPTFQLKGGGWYKDLYSSVVDKKQDK